MYMGPFPAPHFARSAARYAFELLVIGGIYFGLAKIDWALGAIHPNSLSVSLAPGFGLAAVLLRGLRIWPAIFAAASASTVMAGESLTDAILTVSIAAGNALEA